VSYDAELSRGAFVNLVGLIAKLVHPLLFVVITWLFGTNIVGLYFLAVFLVEIAKSAVYAGYDEATTVFVSATVDEHEGDIVRSQELYKVLSNAFVVPLVLSTLIIVVALLGVDQLVATVYADKPSLVTALTILVWSVPLTAIPQTCIAAAKARFIMEHDALINGFVKPLGLLVFSVAAWVLDAGLDGLMWAHVCTQGLMSIMALVGLARHFSVSETLRAMLRFRMHWEMLSFAIPQNLNMTFNKYQTRLDVIMLGAFGFSNHLLAFYSAAALVTSNLRQIKLIFSGAIAPMIARYKAVDNREALEGTLSRVSRWTTTLIAPAVLASLVIRDDIMILVDPGFVGDTLFIVLLLVPPYLSCATGLAGNCIVYTKHTRWNLLNSIIVAVLNTGFNLLFIPLWGLLGAAFATMFASTLVSGLQLVELWYLERVTIRWSAVAKPHIGFLLCLGLLGVMWDPARIDPLAVRLGIAVGIALLFGVLMLAMKHPEAISLYKRSWRRLKSTPD